MLPSQPHSQKLLSELFRAHWLCTQVHLPDTVTTMYCWDTGDGARSRERSEL